MPSYRLSLREARGYPHSQSLPRKHLPPAPLVAPRPCSQPRLRGQQKSFPAGEAKRESSQHVERVSEGLQGCSRAVRFFRQKDSLLCIFSFSSLLHPFFLQFYLIKIHLSTGCQLLWTGHALSLKAPTPLALPPAPIDREEPLQMQCLL